MRVLSVNICREFTMVTHAGKTEPTGHFKTPVTGPARCRLTKEGLEGDHVADKAHHGGQDMAVYALSSEIHRFWSEHLGRTDLVPSKFGENLTIEGLPDERVHIGDTMRIRSPDGQSGALFQVSVPRAPCFKLGIAMGDPAFPKAFLATCRVGYYLRVLEEGSVAAGDTIEVISHDPAGISVRDITHLMYFDPHNKPAAARASNLQALKQSWRDRFAERAAS